MKIRVILLFCCFLLISVIAISQEGGFLVKDLTVSGRAEIHQLKVASSIDFPSDISNIIIGYNAGNGITTGTHNVAIGNNSLAGITNHRNNTVLGMKAFSVGSGDNNTIIGYEAGAMSVSGSENVFIGYQAGKNLSVSNTLVISNSSEAQPLIMGDFSSDEITINGVLKIRDLVTSSSNQVLVYDNGIRVGSFSATETDPTVAGYIKAITSSEVTNWNTAYGWGDHSGVGYLTSYTETDPTVAGYIKAITSSEVTNWNTAYGWGDHSGVGYLTSYTETDPNYTAVASDILWWSDTVNQIATQYDLSLISGGGSGLWYETSNITKNTDNQLVEITAPTGAPTSLTVTGAGVFNGTYALSGSFYVNGGYYIYFKQNYWCLHTDNTSPYFQATYISTSLIGSYNEVGGTGIAAVSATAGGDLGLKVSGAGEFQGLKTSSIAVGNALFNDDGEQLTITMVDPVAGVALDFVVNDKSRLTIPRQGNNLATQMWRSVLIGADKNTLSTESAVNVTLTPFDSDFIPCMTGTFGADLGVEHNVHVLGAIRADSAMLTDLVVPVGNVLTVRTNSGLQLDSFVETTSDVQIPSDNAFYFGDKDIDGSWRIIRSGNNLLFQQRVSGSWVTKDTMLGS
jgi:hypothetical protein